MKQHEFIMNVQMHQLETKEIGNVISSEMNEGVTIDHDFSKNDLITISFKHIPDVYVLKDTSLLDHILMLNQIEGPAGELLMFFDTLKPDQVVKLKPEDLDK